MPGLSEHQKITRTALELAQFGFGENEKLIADYSSYPDFWFSGRRAEVEPYMFLKAGIQFHYPPDTPYVSLYRYWTSEEDGFHRRLPYVNENFHHVYDGFVFYLTECMKLFRAGSEDEAKKFLGCLLHMLEDSTFGLHALEGAGGSDAFYLDRLSGIEPLPSIRLAMLKADECTAPQYQPRVLGHTVGVTAMRLYGAYAAFSADSRRAAFAEVTDTPGQHVQRMFDNAVKLCADLLYTIRAMLRGEAAAADCYIDELEPYELPFNGGGSYFFRSFDRNCFRLSDGSLSKLQLCGRSGIEEFEHGIAFGSGPDRCFCWYTAPGEFSEFCCELGFAPGTFNSPVTFELLSDGGTVGRFVLDKADARKTVSVKAPEGITGLRLCGPGDDVIIMADARLTV